MSCSVSSFILGMHARFLRPFCFIMCTNFYIHMLYTRTRARTERIVYVCVCVSASQINSVALEPKIYYQIKFLTEFIALSLAKHSSFAFRQHPTSIQQCPGEPCEPATNPARTQQRPGTTHRIPSHLQVRADPDSFSVLR